MDLQTPLPTQCDGGGWLYPGVGKEAHAVRCPGCINCGGCSFKTRNDCWDDQELKMDPNFTCPIHGRAEDTLERLGVGVL